MSQRIMYISAYDALDHVVVGCSLYEHDGVGGDPQKTLEASVQVRGLGRESERQWAVDALVALLEVI